MVFFIYVLSENLQPFTNIGKNLLVIEFIETLKFNRIQFELGQMKFFPV